MTPRLRGTHEHESAGERNGQTALLSVEIPVIERYNEGRDPVYRIRLYRVGNGLLLRYALKPCHNVYQMETRLVASYPTVPPETRVLTPLKHCPHLLEGQTLCLWRQGSTRHSSRWDPCPVHLRFRGPGRLALAGVLRDLARNRRMAAAGGEVKRTSRIDGASSSRSARAAAGCRSLTCLCRDRPHHGTSP